MAADSNKPQKAAAGEADEGRFAKLFKTGKRLRGQGSARKAAPVIDGTAVRIGGWGEWRVVYGLHWQAKPPPLHAGPPVMVRWRNVWAVASDKLHVGAMPLAALITDSLGIQPKSAEWTAATIIAASKPDDGLYWATILACGEPLPGRAEEIFDSLDALTSWVQRECSQGEIEQVLASSDVLQRLQVPATTHVLDEAGPAHPDLVPVLENRPWPVLIRFAALAAALAGIAWGAWLLVDTFILNRPQAEIETREVAYVLPIDTFLARCHEELRKPWPVPPGWETEIAGCTVTGMDDPHVQPRPGAGGVAYRKFVLGEGHSATLARAAATALLEDFDGRQKITDAAIVLERPLGVERRKSVSDRETVWAELRAEAESMFLGLAEEVRTADRAVEIRTTASIPTIIRRLVELHQKQPISLQLFTRGRDGLTLRVVPMVTIWVEVRV